MKLLPKILYPVLQNYFGDIQKIKINYGTVNAIRNHEKELS